MDAHQVEPILLLGPWLVELDFLIPKRSKEPLVSDVAHAVEGKLRLPLLDQHRLHLNVVRLGGAAIVVDQTGGLE